MTSAEAAALSESLDRGLKRVGHAAQIERLAAELLKEAADHEAVRVVDATRRQGFARLHELVARKEDADSKTAVNLDVGAADGRDHADRGGRQAGALLEHDAALRHVGAAAADPCALAHGDLKQTPSGVTSTFFLGHDRVGTLGHRRAREDARDAALRKP